MNSYKLLSSLEESNRCQFDFIRGFSNYPSLFFIGLFYVVGLWIDKFIIWFSTLSDSVLNFLYVAPAYDQSAFLTNLLIIPGNVLFLSIVEVHFIKYYKAYYEKSISGTLDEILNMRSEMTTKLFNNIFKIILVQTVIVMFVYQNSKYALDYLSYDSISKNIFFNFLIGNVFNVLILIILTLLLYYEERIKALLIAMLFFIFNTLGTIYFLSKGVNSFGLGYSFASIIVYFIALIMIVITLAEVNYKLFGVNSTIYINKKRSLSSLADKLRLVKGVELDE